MSMNRRAFAKLLGLGVVAASIPLASKTEEPRQGYHCPHCGALVLSLDPCMYTAHTGSVQCFEGHHTLVGWHFAVVPGQEAEYNAACIKHTSEEGKECVKSYAKSYADNSVLGIRRTMGVPLGAPWRKEEQDLHDLFYGEMLERFQILA